MNIICNSPIYYLYAYPREKAIVTSESNGKYFSHNEFLTCTFIFCCEFDLEQDFTDNYTLPTIIFK